MSAAQTLRPGRYRHFKGKEYELLFLATHSADRPPLHVYWRLTTPTRTASPGLVERSRGCGFGIDPPPET